MTYGFKMFGTILRLRNSIEWVNFFF